MPPGLRESESFQALTQKAHERVWQDYQNLDTAWQDAGLRSSFLLLPQEGVERVISRNELRAASENVVYVAVASWVAHQHR